LPLFGEHFHAIFLQTCNSPDFQEYDDFVDVINNQSIFQARHIHQLAKTVSPPPCLLLHIDLKHVVHTLGYKAAIKEDQKRIKKKTDIPTSSRKRLEPEVCDLMTSSYLKNPFFSRFKEILVNTIDIDHERNSLQFKARRRKMGKRGAKTQLFRYKSSELAKQAHDVMYDSWERNTYLLKPEKIFHTLVSDPGDLLLNNQCICKNWSQKNGFD
jgi:hypothetical protein